MKKWLIVILGLVIVLYGIITVLNRDLLKKEVKKVTVSQEKIVKVARVTLNDSGIVFPLVGRINANRSVIITPEVKGRVSKVLVNSTQVVKEGDILLELDKEREIALLNEEQARFNELKRKLEVSQTLHKKGVFSIDAIAQLKAQVSAQESLVQAKEYEVNIRTIRAPFTGVLSLHSITKGQYVKPEDTLLQLDDLSSVYVDFLIPERFLSEIEIGQELTATTDAWHGKIFVGKITHIDTHVDSKTLAVGVRVYFSNKNLELLDGMMIEVDLALSREKLPSIPLKAVNYLGDDRFVYVLKKNNTVSRRKVILGPINGQNVSIRKGLRVNSLVVIEGLDKINDGDLVKPQMQEEALDLIDDVPLKKKGKTSEDIVL